MAYDSPLMSRFDLPAVTRPATDVCHERDCRIPVAEPLPALVAPTLMPPVLHPADEPLMPVEHPRLATYGNYAAAGWTHAYPTTLLRRAVFDRLVAAAESLPAPWGIGVFDGWRPLSLQIELFQAAYCDPSVPPGFVAEPSTEPTEPPPHLTGGTVDCTLTYDGIALALGCGFDDFTARAHTDALENEPGVASTGRCTAPDSSSWTANGGTSSTAPGGGRLSPATIPSTEPWSRRCDGGPRDDATRLRPHR